MEHSLPDQFPRKDSTFPRKGGILASIAAAIQSSEVLFKCAAASSRGQDALSGTHPQAEPTMFPITNRASLALFWGKWLLMTQSLLGVE